MAFRVTFMPGTMKDDRTVDADDNFDAGEFTVFEKQGTFVLKIRTSEISEIEQTTS